MRYIKLFIVVIAILYSASCNKKSSEPEIPLATFLTAPGSWSITTLLVGIVDKSSEFDGYTFVFTDDGKVNATLQNTNVQGTWKAYYSEPTTGPLSRELMLTLSFPYSEKFDMISKTWPTFGVSSDNVSLSNGELIFTKN